MPTCPFEAYQYVIKAGDTLSMIARRFHTNIPMIASLNPGLDISKLSIGQIICIPQEYNPTEQPISIDISNTEQMLSNHMRLLWEQHVYWTLLFILGITFGLPNAELITTRLLRNPKDFEKILIPVYGETLAAEFSQLFTAHLTIAAELVKAAKAGNNAVAADAERRWYENADQIAAFFSRANPYWSAQEWQKMLYDHLAMTKNAAANYLTQKYVDAIRGFDDIERQALAMADMMTQGIVKQFPEYFIR